MATCRTELEARLYNALKRISAYQWPEQLHRSALRQYGVEGPEAIEMAYENVIAEAKNAIKGVRARKESR